MLHEKERVSWKKKKKKLNLCAPFHVLFVFKYCIGFCLIKAEIKDFF